MPCEHDISIMWGNKPTYNRFKVAIDIQDAGNLRAIAREFVKVVESAYADCQSTEATWRDPAVIMLVNKFESLCRSEAMFSLAYKACQFKAIECGSVPKNPGTIVRDIRNQNGQE